MSIHNEKAKKVQKVVIISAIALSIPVTLFLISRPQTFRQYAESPETLCGDAKCSILEDHITCPKDCNYNLTNYNPEPKSPNTAPPRATPTPTVSL